MDSTVSASSEEADCAALAGAETLVDAEASSDHETRKDPDAPYS